MFTRLRVIWIAYKLGLRDKGCVGRKNLLDSETGVWREYRYMHAFCQTEFRVGILKTNGHVVHWCYRCESCFPDSEDGKGDGNGGGNAKTPPSAPPPIDDKFSVQSERLTKKVIEKMKNPS